MQIPSVKQKGFSFYMVFNILQINNPAYRLNPAFYLNKFFM